MLQPLRPQTENLFALMTGSFAKAGATGFYSSQLNPAASTPDTSSSNSEEVDAGVADTATESLFPHLKNPEDPVQLSREAREIAKLVQRDTEVRTHEAAHAAVGGRYAGSPSLTYKSGPDGRSYAVGGEVSIDVSPVAGDPQATIEKAQTIRAAALAPAQPSAQDMRVAARAMQMAAKAYAELSAQSPDKAVSSQPASDSDASSSQAPTAESGLTGQAFTPGTPSSSAPSTPSPTSLSIWL